VSKAHPPPPAAGPPNDAAVVLPPTRVRVWRTLASLAVAAALLVGVLPQLADLSEVATTLGELTGAWIALLLVGALWNIATYQFVMMAALPGLSMGKAFVAGQLSTAIANTVPAGAVVGVGVTYTVLRSFGHDTQRIAIAAAVTGVWNTFLKLGLPVVALALLTIDGEAPAGLLLPALVGLAVLVTSVVIGGMSLSRESIARRTGEQAATVVSWLRQALRRPPVTDLGDRFASFQRRSSGLLRDRWTWLTLATLVSHVSLYLMLLASLRSVGVDATQVSWTEALGAFAFVRLATALPITPGGLGVVELGFAAALTLAGGREAPVVAAVLLFRALTYALQVPLGALSWVVWRRATAGGRLPPPTESA
jgi:putative heme transporter